MGCTQKVKQWLEVEGLYACATKLVRVVDLCDAGMFCLTMILQTTWYEAVTKPAYISP